MEARATSLPSVGPDGTIYASDIGGGLHAIAPDGRRRWRVTLPSYCARPAAAPDGTVYVECNDRKLYAVAPGS
jgi:outer membrane protein assembly factor BamB